MASEIQIKTQQVKQASVDISTCNNNILNAMEPVASSVRALNSAWNSSAGDKAIETFCELEGMYKDNRYNVIQNYVDFLNQQIGLGYEETEMVNVKLADAFK